MPISLTVQKTEGKPGQVYYPLKLNEVPKPTPREGEVLIRLSAAALNHRDLFIRQHLYPAISFDRPMLADGCGVVVEVGPGCSSDGNSLLHKSVVLMPSAGWESDPEGPEGTFAVLGSSKLHPAGMAQEYVAFPESQVELAPEHLSFVETAALPLVGLTGWRAFVTKSGNAERGRNILVTGIGGGVALQVLQFAIAMGCNVYVTSGDEAKIERAKTLGAKGGVTYKNARWDKELLALLPGDRKYLDAVVDGAGGDIVARTAKILKQGGVISQYGMTLGPKMEWSMAAVLKNIELRGSTMGSHAEFVEMVKFVKEKKIKPVVSRVVYGLDNVDGINGLFEDMKAGKQFGKLVVDFGGDSGSKL
ncbi:zinc-binding dehydrogenase [Zalerion maritima]|uniref:Zinc-binding dehydrogenase n=1 Tax=Zalerion maritima TaxID=339359 RepID=A0AAD5RL56_9PEZI|nr:zinc-binding dehydrogenase [Zalerion maritima]